VTPLSLESRTYNMILVL